MVAECIAINLVEISLAKEIQCSNRTPVVFKLEKKRFSLMLAKHHAFRQGGESMF